MLPGTAAEIEHPPGSPLSQRLQQKGGFPSDPVRPGYKAPVFQPGIGIVSLSSPLRFPLALFQSIPVLIHVSESTARQETCRIPGVRILRAVEPGDRRVCLFDFDGTLSLIREGWQAVMIDYFVEELAGTGTSEPESELRALVEDFVARLTGKQTIYQMFRLGEELEKRGVPAGDPVVRKHEYHARLWAVIRDRVRGLEDGRSSPEDWLLPGSRDLLEALSEAGLSLYLASGTDLEFVRREVGLLQLDRFFGDRIFGALDRYRDFSKRMLIEQIFSQVGIRGDQLVAFGDGYVEIEETRKVGGIAIGVASNEKTRNGCDPWKVHRLTEAGADALIPDFRDLEAILGFLSIRPEGDRP